MLENIAHHLEILRKTKPLVLCLTNYVTMDLMANCLLALGAAPLMSHDLHDLEDLIQISHALNLNIGTLDPEFNARTQVAAQLAKDQQKPVILDPVGAGASKVRTAAAIKLIPFANIIRGNASEILALTGNACSSLGVESIHAVSDAKLDAKKLASHYQCTVVVSGKQDFITDSQRNETLEFGSPLMPLVTGMGCTLTAVIAAFSAVIADPFEAAFIATHYYTLCGNLAENKTNKPGSFRTAFIDELYAADFEQMRQFIC